ncbi:hypothetical protein [Luteolibacter luteus]|uniref:Uncharacterized protein n=1 Tax=Luteolibacter luteus TaxID=2728835 RepID=A0A858REV1_9BACT|nr:hypothetical protein [Luteolibacter luteus]QJE95272.1 hypothetical protein HHL09_05600 [Luteolibacter luteus]
MRSLIIAFASVLPAEGIPDEIVYLPEGEHRITPFVYGKAQAVTVKVPAARGVQIAASLQAALDRRQQIADRPMARLALSLRVVHLCAIASEDRRQAFRSRLRSQGCAF